MNVKKLQAEISKVALSYVKPNSPCIELSKDRGGCIDELKCYFYNSGKDNSCSKIGSEAYCAITAWSFVHKAFVNLGIDTAILKSIKTARAVTIKNLAQKFGVRVDKNYKIGDIFYRRSGDPTASGHVGIIVGYDDKFIYTVEGNNTFSYKGKKRQGVWEWKYPLSAINQKGFEFIHIGEYINTLSVNYTYSSKINDIEINYGGGDGWGITQPQAILGILLFGSLSYYAIKKSGIFK